MRVRGSISTSRRLRIGSGPARATLMPLVEAIRAHVFAAERIHADDTTVPFWRRVDAHRTIMDLRA